MTTPRNGLLPRPRALAVALASSAAATLHGSPSPSIQPASVQAVAQLGRHAVRDARDAVVTAPRSPRRARRLLARSSRRLRHAHTLAGLLQAERHAAAAQATGTFAQASSEVACCAATLACQAGGPLEGLAARTLRRAAALQGDLAFALASSRFAGSLTELRHALQEAVSAQDQLLTALTSVTAAEQRSLRRRRALRAARGPARDAREALAVALGQVRSALSADEQQAVTGASAGSAGGQTPPPDDNAPDIAAGDLHGKGH